MLSELSKIRRFILADVKKSALSSPEILDAYNTYWLEMENNFLEAEGSNLFGRFMNDFMIIQKNGVLPKPAELMNEFAEYYNNACRYQKKELVLRNIYRYSAYFLKIHSGDISDADIQAKINKINQAEAYDAYPFLMEVFEDYDYAHINKGMLLDILETVMGFVNERESIEPSAVSLSFAGLSGEINKMMVLKDYIPKFIVDDTPKQNNTINSIVGN